MTFAVHCPHCDAANEDPFEVMARGDVDWMNCAACRRKFFFLIAECQACEEECEFAWQAAPSPEWTRVLRCSHCDQPLELSDDARLADHFGRR
jgi:hypothetical protein